MAAKWYAIQSYASSELSVKKAILHMVAELGIEDKVEQIVVPTEDVIEIKNAKQKRLTMGIATLYFARK